MSRALRCTTPPASLAACETRSLASTSASIDPVATVCGSSALPLGLRLAALSLLALLSACGVAPRAVVVDRPGQERGPSRGSAPPQDSGRMHIVQRGDTLYSIAFRHRLEYRQIAAWNGIGEPYTIYPGQRLRLSPPGQAVAQTGSRPAPNASAGGIVQGSARPAPASTPATGGAASRPASPATTPPVASTPTPPPTTPGASTAPAPVNAPPAPRPSPSAPSGPVRWQWPTSGQIVGRFVSGDPTRQGLSIAGSAGQPVHAAGAGVVVYSGSGLIGYGELVIIKHNDEFLSAYGHNRKRLVAEGEQVRAGQQIAEMGRSGAARDMLHFEIRRSGRPVDPLAHLPAR
jgi:lipoprotein NlpD